MSQRALIVVDVQKAFDDPSWGPRDNPEFEGNVAALLRAWRARDQPVVFVRHDSAERDSPLRPESPGNAFQDVLTGEPAAIVTKSVNSAFLGDPDLAVWLRARRIEAIAVCGIQTNFCCETSARMGANLGFDVQFVLDATHTFDLLESLEPLAVERVED